MFRSIESSLVTRDVITVDAAEFCFWGDCIKFRKNSPISLLVCMSVFCYQPSQWYKRNSFSIDNQKGLSDRRTNFCLCVCVFLIYLLLLFNCCCWLTLQQCWQVAVIQLSLPLLINTPQPAFSFLLCIYSLGGREWKLWPSSIFFLHVKII